MPKINAYTPGDDLPKENPWQEDRLGYRPFTERLAKVITALNVPNGYVIGLQGEWGSGKSTALNFVKAFLQKHNQEAEADSERITPVDFRPWIVSGHQDLITAFFKVMSESLVVRRGWWARQLYRLMRLLKISTEPMVDAVAKVAVKLDPSVGVASAAAAAVTKKSINAMVDTFLEEPSLQSTYEELKQTLAETGKRFLIIIDDLDRLEDEEIRSIMQMVKTVGRLPNVIYLLAYDRGIVWDALDSHAERIGPRFAEKIVQQEIELPRPSKESLLAILDEETTFLPEPASDSLRWHYIVRDGVRRWIRHPRDVLRLANAAKFSWPALQGEIDPHDLLAMEGLRLFDPEAFDWIRSNRDFLFTEGRFILSSDEVRKGAVQVLKDRVPSGSREEVIHVLSVLFPQQAKLFQDKNSSSVEQHSQVLKRRGIGCQAGYDAYFELHPSSDAIPKAVIDEIIAKARDVDALVAMIEPFIGKLGRTGQPLVGSLLEELRVHFQGTDRAEPTQALLDALFEVGEPIIRLETRPDLFTLAPRAQLLLTIGQFLEAWGPGKAGEHLKTAFGKCKSPMMCAAVFVECARDLGEMSGEKKIAPTIAMDDLTALGEKLLPVIENAAANGTLAGAPYYVGIVGAWKYLAGSSTPRAWLSNGVQASAEFLAKVTMGMVSYSLSSRQRSYSMDTQPDPDLYDLEVLLAAARKHLAGRELDTDQRNRITVVADRLECLVPKTNAAKSNLSV